MARMTAAAITVRLARARDARAIAAMSRDLIETGLGWTYRPERIARLIADRETVVLVACDTERVVGFAIMTFGDERAHLVLLATGPSHRRRGVARRLLEWLVESAITAGIASLHLELRADNTGARAFYRAMGFSETLLLAGYYGGREPAMRMLRLLRVQGLLANVVPGWKPQ